MKATLDLSKIPPELKDKPVIYCPHPGRQTEFHARNEDLVLYGGSKGPGKTQALLFESTRQIGNPKYKGIIFRRTFPKLQEIIDRAKLFFPQVGGKWEGQEHRFRFPSGATIAFGHCEHEDSKFNYQGHEFQFMGFDQLEEFTESQFRFLLAQCRTSDPTIRCYVRATANPGNVGHWWIKRMFIDRKVPAQRYEEHFGEHNGVKLVRSSTYIPATINDNPTLVAANPQYVGYLRSLPETERKAFLEGDWAAFDSGCIFDRKGMAAQEALIRGPSWVGYLIDSGVKPEFVMDEKGPLHVWVHPRDVSRYFIAADVAKGVAGGDQSVAVVLDRSNWEVVAVYRGRVEPFEFARALYGLGLYFNTAKIAVEVWPGPGSAVGPKLVEMKYPMHRLYRRLIWDGEKHDSSNEVGWVTDARGRSDLITALQDAVLHNRVIVRDDVALDEMRNFVRNERGRFEARSECHDDHVIALGIACFCMVHDPVAEMAGESALDNPSTYSAQLVKGRQDKTFRGPGFRRLMAGRR